MPFSGWLKWKPQGNQSLGPSPNPHFSTYPTTQNQATRMQIDIPNDIVPVSPQCRFAESAQPILNFLPPIFDTYPLVTVPTFQKHTHTPPQKMKAQFGNGFPTRDSTRHSAPPEGKAAVSANRSSSQYDNPRSSRKGNCLRIRRDRSRGAAGRGSASFGVRWKENDKWVLWPFLGLLVLSRFRVCLLAYLVACLLVCGCVYWRSPRRLEVQQVHRVTACVGRQ